MDKSYFLQSALKSVVFLIDCVQEGKLQIVSDVDKVNTPYTHTLDSFLNWLQVTAANGLQHYNLDKKQFHKMKGR